MSTKYIGFYTDTSWFPSSKPSLNDIWVDTFLRLLYVAFNFVLSQIVSIQLVFHVLEIRLSLRLLVPSLASKV